MEKSSTHMSSTLSLLDRMKRELPEIWEQAQVVGKWVWLEFNIPPAKEIRGKLKKLGFHYNGHRKCWQHPCGFHRTKSGNVELVSIPDEWKEKFFARIETWESESSQETQKQIDQFKSELAVIKQKIDRINNGFADGTLDVQEFKELKNPLVPLKTDFGAENRCSGER